MTRLNPELQRNIWLEFSRHRLIATPLLITVIFLLLSSVGLKDSSLSYAAMVSFLLFTFLWGGYKAAEAVLDEINDNTWDFQRLSSLSPWSLAIGKLFGSTAFVWYGSLMLLGIYVCLSLDMDSVTPPHTVLTNTLLLLQGALVCHSAALLSSLQAARYASASRTKMRVVNHQILGIIAGLYTISTLNRDSTLNGATTLWYGQIYALGDFMACLSFLIFLWLLLGIYWQMRAQLKMRTNPLPWAGFVVFIMVLFVGFRWNDAFGLYMAFIAGMVLFYIMLIQEAWNGITYRQLQDAWRKKRWATIIQLFPRWLLTLMLAALAGLLFVVLHASNTEITFSIMEPSVAAFIFFALRDAGILHYFRLAPGNRRAYSVAILYIFILYGLIPWLLAALRFQSAIYLFVPFFNFSSSGMMASMVSGLVQAIIVWGAVRHQWRRYWQSI